jgi:superfamily I DNA/RNA helicase
LKKGFYVIERGFHKALNKYLEHCTSNYIREKIVKYGFKNYRDKVFDFIDAVPSTKDKTLNKWADEANFSFRNQEYNVDMSVNQINTDIDFDHLFKIRKEIKYQDYFIGTIHSAKGKTFEAVLLILSEHAGQSLYKNIIFPNNRKILSSPQKEELRNVYVAITRPKIILLIAVPQSDCDFWQQKLLLN